MKFELVKKVPIVELDGKKCFVDTGAPCAVEPTGPGVWEFFGIHRLHVAGRGWLKRFTKFDYLNHEITRSEDPVPLEGETMRMEIRENCKWPGWLVKMTVGGVEGMRYIDTGAAFSYVHNLSKDFPSDGNADECAFDGRPWTAPMRRVPCEFAGHPFEILCGDARDNKARLDCCAVPPEGVIGYDFFTNFTVVIDRIGGKMTFVKN